MGNIVLMTSEYPYGNGENFIEPELEYVKNRNDKFYVLPVYRPKKKEKSRHIPKAISLLKLSERKRGIVYGRIKVIFSKPFICGIKELYSYNKLNKCTLMELYKFVYAAYVHKVDIQTSLQNAGIDVKDTILYSYWMDSISLSIAMLKEEFGYKMSITRTHGGDLYDERLPWKHQFLRKYITESLDYVFPVSIRGKDYLDNRIGIHSNVIPMHLGIDDWGGEDNFYKTNKVIIVSCFYISKVKRISLIIDALEKLEFEFMWYHIGAGQELQYIQEQARLRLKGSYKFLGNVSNSEVHTFYKKHSIDIFINASETEGIPVSIMEAMSHGIPSIATDVGGVRELILDQYNGYLLPKDIGGEELAAAINRMRLLPEALYMDMRKNARETFCQYWSSKKNFSEFYQFIKGES